MNTDNNLDNSDKGKLILMLQVRKAIKLCNLTFLYIALLLLGYHACEKSDAVKRLSMTIIYLITSGTDRHLDINFYLDCRYRVVVSSSLVFVLFR